MKNLTTAVVFSSVLLSCQLPHNEDAQVSRVDLVGTSINDHWHIYGEGKVPSIWYVEEGTIICDPLRDGVYGDLISDQKFQNFELDFQWKIDSAGNSGVFIGVVEDLEKYPTAWASGPEYQLLDDQGVRDHNYRDSTRQAGCLYSFQARPNDIPSTKGGTWYTTRIIKENGEVHFYLNDRLTATMNLRSSQWNNAIEQSGFSKYEGFGEDRLGHLALQSWGGGVQFKNVKIKELNP